MPKLRDGIMKRGATWSYVIRVKDPATGLSTPKRAGGFATEDDAKQARDEARVKARRGEYIDRSTVSVAEYLDEWVEGHAIEIKPKTLRDYRLMIRLYIAPRIGGLRLQALRPATITKLNRDLINGGGRNGGPLSPRTVAHVHTVLRHWKSSRGRPRASSRFPDIWTGSDLLLLRETTEPTHQSSNPDRILIHALTTLRAVAPTRDRPDARAHRQRPSS